MMKSLSRKEIVKKLLPSIFMVENKSLRDRAAALGTGVIGTAFALGQGPYLVTAKHVVEATLKSELSIMSTLQRRHLFMRWGRTEV